MRYTVGLIATLIPLVVWAKNPTVSGFVLDSKTGERLIGATVMDLFSGVGTVTNVNGFYSLTIPADSVHLQAGYVGYDAPWTEPFVLRSDTLIELPLESSNILEEVVISGKQSVSAPQSVQMSAVEVPVSQIKGIPAIGGEVDVIKAIQLLPGVQSAGEGSAGIYVRGGGPDENLVMLDGAPLYNINHALGMFSVFNADAIKNVTLYKGNFPARFGSRLSSVIDVWQKEGNNVRQTGRQEATLCIEKHIIDSDHYTCKFRARKDEGAEGFIIVFNYVDEKNYCWVNFGGWTNTQHAIEQISNGGKLLADSKRGRVEPGRWYDVTLQVAGDSVKAWLDNELVFNTVLKHDVTKGIFSSATIDDTTDELIVKVANTSDAATTARLNLKHFTPNCARVVRLAANDGMEENTLQAPTTIHPVEQLLSPKDGSVLLDVPPYSLNIVRIKEDK